MKFKFVKVRVNYDKIHETQMKVTVTWYMQDLCVFLFILAETV